MVDQAALLKALQQERIGGAALDVFETEPLPESNPLWRLPNVVISPHIGGTIGNEVTHLADCVIEDLCRYKAKTTLS